MEKLLGYFQRQGLEIKARTERLVQQRNSTRDKRLKERAGDLVVFNNGKLDMLADAIKFVDFFSKKDRSKEWFWYRWINDLKVFVCKHKDEHMTEYEVCDGFVVRECTNCGWWEEVKREEKK